MRELVLVVSDLYVPEETPTQALPAGALPGLEYVGRFATRTPLAGGWRAWLAHWLGREDLAALAPARIAAAVLPQPPPAGEGTLWFATPVHLSAGLARVHLTHQGLLRLSPQAQGTLAQDFAVTFSGADLELLPLQGGELLLRTPAVTQLSTREPARSAGGELMHSLAAGVDAGALRRLSTEIEMWLHVQPLNAERRRRGELPVSALWLWGGEGGGAEPSRRTLPLLPVAYGDDAYLQGLWHLHGGAARGLPEEGAALLSGAEGERAVVVTGVSEQWVGGAPRSFTEALQGLDERWLGPTLRALRAGRLGRVTLLANDACYVLHRHSALRIWRARRAGLASLT